MCSQEDTEIATFATVHLLAIVNEVAALQIGQLIAYVKRLDMPLFGQPMNLFTTTNFFAKIN